jgi:hypothetical protein
MALDYRYVVGKKHMRDAKKHNTVLAWAPKKTICAVMVRATGEEGIAEVFGCFESLSSKHPVTVSFGCHGQKRYIRSALEVIKNV